MNDQQTQQTPEIAHFALSNVRNSQAAAADTTTIAMRFKEVLTSIPDELLLSIREDIEKHLRLGLVDFEPGHEMSVLYRSTKNLLNEALEDGETPLNQKTQAVNSLREILMKLVESQREIFGIDRQRKFEKALAKTLEKMPAHMQAKFMEMYANELKANLETETENAQKPAEDLVGA